MAAEIKLKIPEFSPKDPEMYLKEVDLWWELAANISEANRVLALLYSVPTDHPSGFKEYLLSQHTLTEYKAAGGKQLFLDSFNTMFAVDTRVKMVGDFKNFTQCKRKDDEDVKKFISRFSTLYTAAKKSGLVLTETARALFLFTAADLSESQMKMAVTRIDFTKTTVSANQATDTQYQAGALPQTEEALKLFLGDLTKDEDSKTHSTFIAKREDSSGLEGQMSAMQQQIEQLVGAVKHSKNGGKKETKAARKAADGKNPFNQTTGARLKCYRCGSDSHLANGCPKPRVDGNSLQASSQQTLHVSTLQVSELRSLQELETKDTDIFLDEVYVSVTVAQIGSHALVLDTGSRSNVSGFEAIEEYIAALDKDDKNSVEKRKPSQTEVINFRFGGGECRKSALIVTIPVQFEEVRARMALHVVDSPGLPMLWGRESVKRLGVLIDTSSDTLHIPTMGVTVQMEEGNGGDHWLVPCLPSSQAVHLIENSLSAVLEQNETRDEEQDDQSPIVAGQQVQGGRRPTPCTRGRRPPLPCRLEAGAGAANPGQFSLGSGKDLIKNLTKIHVQYGHLSQSAMLHLLRMSKLSSPEVIQAVEKLYQYCKTCKRFTPTPSRPKLAKPYLGHPFHMVHMDLADLGRSAKDFKYILYISDAFTNYVNAVLLKDKQCHTVVSAIITDYLGKGWPSFKIVRTDAGGEFNGVAFEDLCGRIGAKHEVTAGHSPWSNGKVEVLHSLVDRILGKYMDNEPNMDIVHALSFAIAAYNSKPSAALGGMSPAQCVFGKDPAIPDLMDASIAGLSADYKSQVVENHIRTMDKVKMDLQAALGSRAVQQALSKRLQAADIEYQPGDRVLFKKGEAGGPHYQLMGPAVILGRSRGTWLLFYMGHIRRVHYRRIVPYDNNRSQLPVRPHRDGWLDRAPDATNTGNLIEVLLKNPSGSTENVPRSEQDILNNPELQGEVEINRAVNNTEDRSNGAENIPVDESVTSDDTLDIDIHPQDCPQSPIVAGQQVQGGRRPTPCTRGRRPPLPCQLEAGEGAGAETISVEDEPTTSKKRGKTKSQHITLEGDHVRFPKVSEKLSFVTEDGTVKSVKILSRWKPSSDYFNVVDSDGEKFGVHLNKVSWKLDGEDGQLTQQRVTFAEEILEENYIVLLHPREYNHPEHKEHVELAKQTEMIGWDHFGVHSSVNEVDVQGQVILDSTWVIGIKNKSNESVTDGLNNAIPYYKARLCAKGNKEEPAGLESPTRADSPTLGRESLRMALAIAATNSWSAQTIDLIQSYLQGRDMERNVYLRPPKEYSTPGVIWKLNKPVYGLRSSGRSLFKKLTDLFTSVGHNKVSGDPCWYVYRDTNGRSVGFAMTHVDDIINLGTPDYLSWITDCLGEVMEIRNVTKDNFLFCGLQISSTDDGFVVHQDEYAKELQPIDLPPAGPEKTKTKLTQDGLSSLREITGRINWLSQTRADIASAVVHLSTHFCQGTIAELKFANKTLAHIKTNPVHLHFPQLSGPFRLLALGDAAFNNLETRQGQNTGSSGGFIVILVGSGDCAIPIMWSSNRITRVVSSSMAAECMVAGTAADAGFAAQQALCSATGQTAEMFPLEVFTDSNDAYQALNLSRRISDRRLRVELAKLADDIERDRYKFSFSPAAGAVADRMSKINSDPGPLLELFNKSSIAHLDFSYSKRAHT